MKEFDTLKKKIASFISGAEPATKQNDSKSRHEKIRAELKRIENQRMTLTLRLKGDEVELVKEAMKESGHKTASKTILHALEWYARPFTTHNKVVKK